ncbi:DNA methyltransferase [Duganella qianjiadongensis]|uniref:site-specific DNA-methyltransferase (adenine-specific) n=1 Tax=Duganella qianjiadongensis TaxID=2692176 RepID=A0ABW9VNH3_9BURK|nr:DNA methyltransferase [Duganella qianjiadongensis]MYM40165.1 N-6 DNA methylase [Duganella qianjiadongensis]
MNISQVEEKVKALVGTTDQAEFLFNLLDCYGKPKASVTRLKMIGKGSYNLSKNSNEVLWKKQVYFKETKSDQLLSVIDEMKHADVVAKHQPRFIIAINVTHLLAIDTKTQDTLDIPVAELNKKFDFFLPWAGLEKTQAQGENPADVKAAEKMAKLFDLLRDNNPAITKEEIHWQNVFLSRILFCYFAEDTGIFEAKLFTNRIGSSTSEDGSDLDDYLSRIFDMMNQESREGVPDYLNFPYVNGGLFADKLPVPKFNKKSRAMLIECGADLNWSEINPDIFGSMIQAVVDPSQRGNMGMHYTNVPNIMKVIEPLFLNELKEEFEKHSDSKTKLEQLLLRLEHLKIFDPACGSGNFLIIAYKELRQLEMGIFKRLQELSKDGLIPLSRIKLSQFYGIELDDFAHEIAILSLWLAEHQMNVKFKATFGHTNPPLPLKNSGNIFHGNALQESWEKICPHSDGTQIFVLGNPPYLGSSLQSDEQKNDIAHVFDGIDGYKAIDLIASWFYKAARYIHGNNTTAAFVSTNSICQGEQVELLWPHIFHQNVEIGFVHQSFKWENNAKKNAAVYCVIIGLRSISNHDKFIFKDGLTQKVENINPYLVATKRNIILSKRQKPLSKLPQMTYGSKPTDGGNLILEPEEKDALEKLRPEAKKFIKRYIGASEHTNNKERWCIWINDQELDEAKAIPEIRNRINLVKEFRLNSTKSATRTIANSSHRFGEPRYVATNSILVPIHGSDRRQYIPFGFLDKSFVASNATQVIYTSEVYVFGLISSLMHNVWIKASCGKIKEDPRYSSTLGYNNFPVPPLTEQSKEAISNLVLEILGAREQYPELNLSDLYDPDLMPPDLMDAHARLDAVVERCYRAKEFLNDEDRLDYLFKLYEKMTGTKNA